MNTIKLTVQEKEWIRLLESTSPVDVLTAIREIRNKGSITMLPYMFKLLHPSVNEIIRKSVLMVVSEIKVQAAAPIIVEALENMDSGEDFTSMVAACWQSGIDFSTYLPAFIKIFAEADYQTAVEAFSVIEESILNAGIDMKNKCLRLLDEMNERITVEKYPLYKELIKVVSVAE
jgi:HEAT repeat protein